MRKDTYEINYKLEHKHWWYCARRNIIECLGRKFIWGKGKVGKILAIGCGTGAELEFLSKFGDVTGLDFEKEAVDYCKRLKGVKVLQASATSLPFPENSFDMVAAFDVIEHIKNDSKAVNEINRVLKPNGYFYLTVPAFQSLWSYSDDIAHHFRRYTRSSLLALFHDLNFCVIKVSYFNFFLFPFVFIVRKIKMLLGLESINSGDVKETNPLVNVLLRNIFSFEKYSLRFFNFPFGVSLICILRKKCHH